MELPDAVKGLLDEKVYVHLATIMPDGSPQVSVVWVDRDGDKVLFSSALGRVKPRNIELDPRVALSFTPPDKPYENTVLRGRVTKTATDGTWLIDRLAKKYLDHESYQFATPGEVRVNYEIEIDAVSQWG
ncbi:MAG: PPOX class F420-dependent oxidoreductase [Actinomycetia bacterium]|nr:PPOX class F420-dependent oxidoreductase [Actinomycetes bacterium]